jgi:hypothetical protein
MKKYFVIFLITISLLFSSVVIAGPPPYHGGYGGGYHGGYYGHDSHGSAYWWGPALGLGLGLGAGWLIWGPPVYNYPPPQTIIVQQPPVVYQAPEPNYWFYCQNPTGYYPYVQTCPSGWMKVVPQPGPPK